MVSCEPPKIARVSCISWDISDCQVILHPLLTGATLPAIMASKKEKEELESETGTWIVKDVPRELMHRVKIAAAIQRKTLKQLLFDVAEAHLEELERKGMLPKGK